MTKDNGWPNDDAEPRATDIDALLEAESTWGNVPKKRDTQFGPRTINAFEESLNAKKIMTGNLPEPQALSHISCKETSDNPPESNIIRFFAHVIAVGIFSLAVVLVFGLIVAVLFWIASMF